MRIEKGHPAGNELNGQTTGARPRLRQAPVDEEGLHRPLHGGAAGADRSGAADAWSASGRSTAATRLRAGAHFVPTRRGGDGRERRGLPDLGGLLAVARPLGRPRLAGARAGAARRGHPRRRSAARRRRAGRGLRALLHRSRRSAAPWLIAPCLPPCPRRRRHPRPLRRGRWPRRASTLARARRSRPCHGDGAEGQGGRRSRDAVQAAYGVASARRLAPRRAARRSASSAPGRDSGWPSRRRWRTARSRPTLRRS